MREEARGMHLETLPEEPMLSVRVTAQWSGESNARDGEKKIEKEHANKGNGREDTKSEQSSLSSLLAYNWSEY